MSREMMILTMVVFSLSLIVMSIFFMRKYLFLYRKVEFIWGEIHILRELQKNPKTKKGITIPRFKP